MPTVAQQRLNAVTQREREIASLGRKAAACQAVADRLAVMPTETPEEAEVVADLRRACLDVRTELHESIARLVERADIVRRAIDTSGGR